MSRVVEAEFVWRNVIRCDDGNSYRMEDWDWDFATPRKWPPVPGDTWRAGEVEYAALRRDVNGKPVVMLEPVNESAPRVYPEGHADFLSLNPILVRRR